MRIAQNARRAALIAAAVAIPLVAAFSLYVRPHGDGVPGVRFSPLSRSAAHLRRDSLPPLILWAWERPEDLRFLAASQNLGVAFLAGTIELTARGSENDDRGFVYRPRFQPLHVPPPIPLIAVVRIESPRDVWHVTQVSAQATSRPSPDANVRRDLMVQAIVAASRLPGVRGVQIDFDASRSKQSFYALLLRDIRGALPREMPLSITALASWCIGDPWIGRLPEGTIDEAVPMLFRMGPDAASVVSFVKSGRPFGPPVCRNSVGVSTDEDFSSAVLEGSLGRFQASAANTRLYVFTDRAWTEDAVAKIRKETLR
jgi:hypothetical protein